MTSVTDEIQAAVRAIRRSTPETASFHRQVAVLLDQIALTTPQSVIESQASPITRRALGVARSFQNPRETEALDPTDPPEGVAGYRMCQRCRTQPAVNGPWCAGSCEQLDHGNEETWWRKAVER